MSYLSWLLLQGTVAYVSQQAWIQNRSLKDGVIFDNPVDEKRYNDVINACALQPDIESFTGGDNTEIGENVNTRAHFVFANFKFLFR